MGDFMKKSFTILFFLSIFLINCASNSSVKENKNIISENLGDLYVANNNGFTMYVPKNWKNKDFNQKYLAVIGPTENNFTPNFTFADEAFTGTVTEYASAVIDQLSKIYANLEVIASDDFVTNSGLQGLNVTITGAINSIIARQKLYIIKNKSDTTVMLIAGSTFASGGEKYDSLFDECVKTFNWKK